MDSLSSTEMRALLRLLKEPRTDYSASTLGKALGITSMGALKILKRLEKQNILKSRKVGKSTLYTPNLKEEYPLRLFAFLLCKEAEDSASRIRRWVREARKLSDVSEAAVLYGSVLKEGKYDDVDLLLVQKPSQDSLIDYRIEEIDKVNVKRIHAVRQTKKDLVRNIRTGDKIILGALKDGIVLFGYDEVVGAIRDGTC